MSQPISLKTPTIEQLLSKMGSPSYFHKNMVREVDEVFKPYIRNEFKHSMTNKLDLLRISAAVLKPVPRFSGFESFDKWKR